MLDEKTIRLLELLDDQIKECSECGIGMCSLKCLPYWTPLSIYLIIGEAPGREEIENNEPFTGMTGRKLWEIMNKLGLRKEEFAIINSIQCRPVTSSGANGKPTIGQMESCWPWIRKFIKVLEPHKALIFGNYAKATIKRSKIIGGIMRYNATTHLIHEFGYDLPIIYSVHPSMCIYSHEQGEELLKESIRVFKEYD